jgi:hypothetical protein
MPEQRSESGQATGTIHPMVAVKAGTNEGEVLECSAGTDRSIGISFRETRRSPYVDTTASPGILALSGEPLSYYTTASDCWAQIGGTVATNDRLTATTGGKLITTTSAGDYIAAIAKGAGVSGEIIPVRVVANGTQIVS